MDKVIQSLIEPWVVKDAPLVDLSVPETDLQMLTLWWWEKRLAATRYAAGDRSLVRVVVC